MNQNNTQSLKLLIKSVGSIYSVLQIQNRTEPFKLEYFIKSTELNHLNRRTEPFKPKFSGSV